MKLIYRTFMIMFFSMTLSCGGSKEPLPKEQEEQTRVPMAANLVFPENNTECQKSNIINDTQSQIEFNWVTAENTDSYELHLENLSNATKSVYESELNYLPLTLLRGAAYRWYIVSKSASTQEVAKSEIWQFYIAAPGEVNYAPFPAELIGPNYNSVVNLNNSSILLQWQAEDIDNDILSYEVYLGTSNPPEDLIATTFEPETSLDLEVDKIYYWSVKTTDSAANSSTSDVFTFSTK